MTTLVASRKRGRQVNLENQILCGDAVSELRKVPDEYVAMCVTSPPYYGLRDYGVDGQIGLEETPDAYVARLVEVFREVRRILRDDGTLWVNIGDSYCAPATGESYKKSTLSGGKATQREAGKRPDKKPVGDIKQKDLIGIPWMLAFALRADGWYLRQEIIWNKPNIMPESVRDRCTKSHESIFLLSKRPKYYFDAEAIKEPCVPSSERRYKSPFCTGEKEISGNGRPNRGKNTAGYKPYTGKRNKRDVWTVTTQPFREAHFATFPPKLIEPCILAGSRENDIVLDPFMGAGTTALVALQSGRRYLGCELNPDYIEIAETRLRPLIEEVRSC